MTEHAPQPSPEMLRWEAIQTDIKTLDMALEDAQVTAFGKADADGSYRRPFSIQALIDIRSGRVHAADTLRELTPNSDQARIHLSGTVIARHGEENRLAEETLILDTSDAISWSALSPIAQTYAEDLLSAWKESHNRYIAHMK